MLYFLHVFCLSEAEVEKHLQDTAGKEGQSCTLSCQLSIPNVEAHWYKNGKQLEMKGRYKSEVKHKVQKLLISDLKHEDQGRYTCRYQHLESSADLWVEGLYLETILQPSRRGGCSARLLTSFDSPHQTQRLMLEIWILRSFFLFLLGFVVLCLNILHVSPLLDYPAKLSSIISFVVFLRPSRLKSILPPTSSHHNRPINSPLIIISNLVDVVSIKITIQVLSYIPRCNAKHLLPIHVFICFSWTNSFHQTHPQRRSQRAAVSHLWVRGVLRQCYCFMVQRHLGTEREL